MATRQFCTFLLNQQFFGVPVQQVQEVIRYQEMTCVPLVPPVIRGLINLRGQIVTSIELRRRFGMAERPAAELPMNVVVRSDDGPVSFLVDGIGDVLELDDDGFEHTPQTLQGEMQELVRGVYKLEDRLLLVLDIERAIAATRRRRLFMGESGARQRGTKHVGGRVFLSSLGGLLVICGLSMGEARAAESCRDTAVASIPSRPTVASATGVTLCGALELEYGLQRTWPGGGAHRSDLFWRPAFRCYAEARLPLVRHGLPQPHRRQRKPQGIRRQLVRSEVPFPDPDQAGSQPGRALHGEGAQRRACPRKFGKGGPAFAFLVSKDVKPFYFDFNLIPQLVGPLAGNGFDHNLGLAWATWLPVTKRWTVVAEPYGFTALNAATPGFASVMGGFSLQVHPRLYLDAGLEVGASHFAPRKRVYGGVTFAAANLYKRLQPQPR